MSWTHPDAQENINSVGASHITNGSICVLILDCSYLTGKRIWSEKGREKGGTSFLCALTIPSAQLTLLKNALLQHNYEYSRLLPVI